MINSGRQQNSKSCRGPVGDPGTKMRLIIANVLFVVMLIPHVLTWLFANVVPSLYN